MNDFLIIGGGIAGLAAGAHLAPHGRVTVVEGEATLAYHASSRSAAMHIPTYGLPSVKAISAASTAAHEALDVLSPRGILVVGRAGEEAAFEVEAEDLGLDPISVSAATALIPLLDPAKITRAAHTHAGWDIDTDALVQHYARLIRANGKIVTGTPVTAIRREGNIWIVTAGTEHRASVIVNAAGPWGDQIAALAGVAPVGLKPYRRSIARIAVPGDANARHWPMMMGAKGDWYAKPDAGALIVSPSEEDPLPPQDAWADDMVLAEGLARYEDHITAEVTRMLANWAGLRTFAPDRQLVIGPDPAAPAFHWMAGQGGYGFQSAPAAGALLAARVLGHAPDLPDAVVAAVDPGRFRT